MAVDEVLAYLVALSLPLWILGEYVVAWWVFRRESRQEGPEHLTSAGSGRPATDGPAGVGPSEAARRAA